MIESIYEEEDILLLTAGSMLEAGLEVRKALKNIGYSCSLNNVRCVNLIEEEAISEACNSHRLIVTMEENMAGSRLGEKVKGYLASRQSPASVLDISVPDEDTEHDETGLFKQEIGTDADSIVKRIITAYIGLGKDYGR